MTSTSVNTEFEPCSITINGIAMETLSTPQELILIDSDPQSDNDNDVQEVKYPEGGLRAYSVVFGSFIGLMATFGTLNSVGAIQAYIATHQLSDVKTSTISWIFSIYTAISFANCMVVGPLFDVKGAMLPMVVGTLMISGGFMAVANCDTVPQFILALAICVGLGNSLNITPLIGVLSHWFNLKRGRAIGMATIGGSVGGIIVPLMLRSLYTNVGFVWAIRILGFFCLACNGIAILLCRSRICQESDTVTPKNLL